MRNSSTRVIRLPLALLLQLAVSGHALTATLRVDKTQPIPPGVYGTIQAAIDASAPGDTISISDGRYDELVRYVFPSGDVAFAVAIVERGPLTLLGDSREGVRMGPSFYIGQIGDGQALCVGALESANSVEVQSVTMENTSYLLTTAASIAISDCHFSSPGNGLSLFSPETVEISTCTFTNFPGEVAVWSTYSQNSRTQILRVLDTEFVNCGQAISLLGVDHVEIASCRFVDCNVGVQFDDATVGSVMNSWFERCGSTVRNFDGSRCHFERNVSLGSLSQGLYSSFGHYTGSHNYIEGGPGAAIQIRGNGTASFQNNTLINGGGWTVHIGARKEYFPDPPPRFDFTNNYWGTADSTQIESWILDERVSDWLIGIDIDPILTESPVATQRQSLGGLKARFAPE